MASTAIAAEAEGREAEAVSEEAAPVALGFAVPFSVSLSKTAEAAAATAESLPTAAADARLRRLSSEVEGAGAAPSRGRPGESSSSKSKASVEGAPAVRLRVRLWALVFCELAAEEASRIRRRVSRRHSIGVLGSASRETPADAPVSESAARPLAEEFIPVFNNRAPRVEERGVASPEGAAAIEETARGIFNARCLETQMQCKAMV